MGYDRFPEELINEKTKLLTDLLQENGALFFTHDPEIALAEVAQDEKGRFILQNRKDSLRAEIFKSL